MSALSGKANKYAGGNAYCPRPTPDWQKGISGFLSPGRSKDKENTEPNNDVEIVGEEDNCQAGYVLVLEIYFFRVLARNFKTCVRDSLLGIIWHPRMKNMCTGIRI